MVMPTDWQCRACLLAAFKKLLVVDAQKIHQVSTSFFWQAFFSYGGMLVYHSCLFSFGFSSQDGNYGAHSVCISWKQAIAWASGEIVMELLESSSASLSVYFSALFHPELGSQKQKGPVAEHTHTQRKHITVKKKTS